MVTPLAKISEEPVWKKHRDSSIGHERKYTLDDVRPDPTPFRDFTANHTGRKLIPKKFVSNKNYQEKTVCSMTDILNVFFNKINPNSQKTYLISKIENLFQIIKIQQQKIVQLANTQTTIINYSPIPHQIFSARNHALPCIIGFPMILSGIIPSRKLVPQQKDLLLFINHKSK